MSNYQKIWCTFAGLFMFWFFSTLIYNGATTDYHDSVLKAISTLDRKNVKNILITPKNPEWRINLTVDTLVVNDEANINNIILALKSLKEKPLKKGERILWQSYLIINLEKSNTIKLKNNKNLIFEVFDTEKGLFIKIMNAMGLSTYYGCEQLKPLLEKLAFYQYPLGIQH